MAAMKSSIIVKQYQTCHMVIFHSYVTNYLDLFGLCENAFSLKWLIPLGTMMINHQIWTYPIVDYPFPSVVFCPKIWIGTNTNTAVGQPRFFCMFTPRVCKFNRNRCPNPEHHGFLYGWLGPIICRVHCCKQD